MRNHLFIKITAVILLCAAAFLHYLCESNRCVKTLRIKMMNHG